MRFLLLPIMFTNQLRSKNLFVKMMKTTLMTSPFSNGVKFPEKTNEDPHHRQRMASQLEEETKILTIMILTEAAKDGWNTVAIRYNVSPFTLSEWKKEFSPEELANMGFSPADFLEDKKQDVAKRYNLSKRTLSKWMKLFTPEELAEIS